MMDLYLLKFSLSRKTTKVGVFSTFLAGEEASISYLEIWLQ